MGGVVNRRLRPSSQVVRPTPEGLRGQVDLLTLGLAVVFGGGNRFNRRLRQRNAVLFNGYGGGGGREALVYRDDRKSNPRLELWILLRWVGCSGL